MCGLIPLLLAGCFTVPLCPTIPICGPKEEIKPLYKPYCEIDDNNPVEVETKEGKRCFLYPDIHPFCKKEKNDADTKEAQQSTDPHTQTD